MSVRFVELEGVPVSRVELPNLMLTERDPGHQETIVAFEGRDRVPYRATDRWGTWAGQVVYSADMRPQARALMDLIDQAYDEGHRLRLCATVSVDGELVDTICAISYADRREPGSVTRLALTIRQVASTEGPWTIPYGGTYAVDG